MLAVTLKGLEAMAHSEIDRIRLRVAENPRTPLDVLELLATDRNADVRIAAGTNPSTPPHVSYSLAFDEDPNVRLGLAEDMNTPIELLDKLTEDEHPYISYRAAQTKEYLRSQGRPRSFGCERFFAWVSKGMDQPELKYASVFREVVGYDLAGQSSDLSVSCFHYCVPERSK